MDEWIMIPTSLDEELLLFLFYLIMIIHSFVFITCKKIDIKSIKYNSIEDAT